jgi:hypothetical protein
VRTQTASTELAFDYHPRLREDATFDKYGSEIQTTAQLQELISPLAQTAQRRPSWEHLRDASRTCSGFVAAPITTKSCIDERLAVDRLKVFAFLFATVVFVCSLEVCS